VIQVILQDPDIASVGTFVGGGSGNTTNSGRMFITLKPREERGAKAQRKSSTAASANWPSLEKRVDVRCRRCRTIVWAAEQPAALHRHQQKWE